FNYNRERLLGIFIHRLIFCVSQGLRVENANLTIALKRAGIQEKDLVHCEAQVKKVIENLHTSVHFAWIIDKAHQESYNEWALTTHVKGLGEHYILDRCFTSDDG